MGVVSTDKVTLGEGIPVVSGEDLRAYARSANSSLSKMSNELTGENFIVKYWAMQSTHDQSVCNCMFTDKKIEVHILGEEVEMTIPLIVSTAIIKAGDEIVVRKTGDASDSSTKRRTSSLQKPAAQKKQKTM